LLAWYGQWENWRPWTKARQDTDADDDDVIYDDDDVIEDDDDDEFIDDDDDDELIIIIIIIIIIRKFITRTCSQALTMNRRRGQSLGGLTVCIVSKLGYKVRL